jgi:sulfur-carrier protein
MRVCLRLRGVLRERAGGRDRIELTLPAAATVHDLLDAVAAELPGVERRIRDESRSLRRHIHVFVDAQDVRPTGGGDHVLHDGAEVLVLPAVSGG